MRVLYSKTPLGLFSTLWAFAAALHYLEADPLVGLAFYPFSILLIFFPENIVAISIFALAHFVILFSALPVVANHSVIALLIDVCLLIGSSQVFWKGGPGRSIELLWEYIRGPIIAIAVIVYLFTIFDKLNSSFFDPSVSCATSQVVKMFKLQGFSGLLIHPEVFSFNIYLTLAIEIAILCLLLWSRFSYVGVTIGLVFHTGLGFAGFFDFATTIFALYLFFLPWERIKANSSAIPKWATANFLINVALLSITSFYFYGVLKNPHIFSLPGWDMRANTFIVLFWMMALLPILLPLFWGNRTMRGVRWRGATIAWIVPALALLNGVTPFLGLKTVANYSMFSNLRTENGTTNHFLIPAGQFFVAGYQNDIVLVHHIDRTKPKVSALFSELLTSEQWSSQNPRWLAEMPDVRVPFVELQRTVQLWHDLGYTNVNIRYERAGKERVVADAFSERELMTPLSSLERKFLAFRAVQNDGEESSCRW